MNQRRPKTERKKGHINNLCCTLCTYKICSFVIRAEKKREKWEQHEQTLNIFISVSSAGLHFAMTDQGDMVASMLLNNSIPVMQIKNYLMQDIRPMATSYGP